jgi:hypothetical protein
MDSRGYPQGRDIAFIRAMPYKARVFVAAVILFMVIFPSVSTLIEALTHHDHAAVIDLIGKWFVFWAVGVRLLTAGARQIIKPGLTSEGILGIKGREAWQLVRELGFANVSIGLVGVISLWKPSWRIPDAIAGGLFLLLAGAEHLPKKGRTAEENLAMYSDLTIGILMGVYVAWRV